MSLIRSFTIDHIELENFKSYKGKTKIGPLKSVNCVIGSIGSGKSNLTDAIYFVLGGQAESTLRVKALSDLIHGSSIGQPISEVDKFASRASVSVVFKVNNGPLKKFSRSVCGSQSEYKIENEIVSARSYLSSLNAMGINDKTNKNIFVPLKAVESVASNNPNEFTSLVEEISGCNALQGKYENLKTDMLKAEEEMAAIFMKKRGILAEQDEAELEKQEAEKYEELKNELAEKKEEYYLFRLFHNENHIRTLEYEIQNKEGEVGDMKLKKIQIEVSLNDDIREYETVSKELVSAEEDFEKFKIETDNNRMEFVKLKERVAHIEEKLVSNEKQLEEARRTDQNRTKSIKRLKQKLLEVEMQEREFENILEIESHSEGINDDQVRQYNNLKIKAQKQAAHYVQELDSIGKKREMVNDQLIIEKQIRDDLQTKINLKRQEKGKALKCLQKLNEHIFKTETSLDRHNMSHNILKNEFDNFKARFSIMERELDSVIKELEDSQYEMDELQWREKEQRVVQNLKKIYRGVFDRLGNKCRALNRLQEPIFKRVFGKYMDAIIVDSEATTKQCIQYLKDHFLAPEVFLPLNVRVKSIDEPLRTIQDTENVKLLVDMLEFDDEISDVVMFVSDNTLVCQTAEYAMHVAYEIGSCRYNVISLDGTFFQKFGIVSGGISYSDLTHRHWGETNIGELKLKREEIQHELNEIMKQLRRIEYELHEVESQKQDLHLILMRLGNNREFAVQRISGLELELPAIEKKFEEIRSIIEQLEKEIHSYYQEIQEIMEKKNSLEDEMFIDFCHRIGVPNVRKYEEQNLGLQQRTINQRFYIENQKNRIIIQLDFEENRDTRDIIKMLEQLVSKDRDELNMVKEQFEQLHYVQKDIDKMEQLKLVILAKTNQFNSIDERICKAVEDLKLLAKNVTHTNQLVSLLEGELEAKKISRYNWLKLSKMEEVATSSILENFDEVVEDSDSPEMLYDRIGNVIIDYSSLADHLKQLVIAEDVEEMNSELAKNVHVLVCRLQSIESPNLRIMQKWEGIYERLQEIDEELDIARARVRKTKLDFKKVKKERSETFISCFELISKEINDIYQSLTQISSAQALFELENLDEPYLGGINYNCTVSEGRLRSFSDLSAGEKTVAVLALIFAVQNFQRVPILVADQIDTTLNNQDVDKVVTYIRNEKRQFQTIFITTNEEFYSHADVLVAVISNKSEPLVSQVVTLDLTKYSD